MSLPRVHVEITDTEGNYVLLDVEVFSSSAKVLADSIEREWGEVYQVVYRADYLRQDPIYPLTQTTVSASDVGREG